MRSAPLTAQPPSVEERQPNRFRIKEFADVIFEFVLLNGKVTELRQTDPSGEYKFVRKAGP